MRVTRGRWYRVVGIVAAVVLLIATAPAEPRAQAGSCGANDGNICQQDEQCVWILFYKRCTTNYKYYPSGGGGGDGSGDDEIPRPPIVT